MQLFDRNNPPEIPTTVAVCPICGAVIQIDDIGEWYADGSVSECGLGVNCTTEPDIDSCEWWGWFHHHWSTPYVDWLCVEERVLTWLNKHYRIIQNNIELEAAE